MEIEAKPGTADGEIIMIVRMSAEEREILRGRHKYWSDLVTETLPVAVQPRSIFLNVGDRHTGLAQILRLLEPLTREPESLKE